MKGKVVAEVKCPVDYSRDINICKKALRIQETKSTQKRLNLYLEAQQRVILEILNPAILRREPTELEKWETVKDAREHRIMNKELTINDYLDKYERGKSLTLIT